MPQSRLQLPHSESDDATQSILHGVLLHDTVSSLRAHGMPPCFGSTSGVRVRDLTPPPHFLEHEPHACQAPSTQSIGQALRLDPGFAPGYVQLAEWYLERDHVDPADTAVERGLAIDGENADLWGLKAELHRARGEWEQSLVAYERAVDLKPDDPALRNNLGNTYQVLGRSREALVQHQRALALVPGDPETLLNMGNALAMDGLYGQAIDHYRRAVAGHRNFAGAWLNMGLVYEKIHQSENALAAYAKAVQLDPTYAPQVAARRRAMGHGP